MRTKAKRFWSILLSFAMIATLCPMGALATEPYTGGICEHHKEHNADCGYAEGQEAVACGHEHTDDCYETVPEEAEGQESVETLVLNCQHEHDADCGYQEEIEAQPCRFVCEICSQQADEPNEPAKEPVNEPEEEPEEQEPQADVELITDWVWNDDWDMMTWDEDKERWLVIVMVASEDNPLTHEALEELLPMSINAAGIGELELEWNLDRLPEEAWTGEYRIKATLPEGYALAEDAKPLQAIVVLGGAETYAVTEEQLRDHIIDTVSPTNITINMFDYWVNDQGEDTEVKMYAAASNNATLTENRNNGINEDHSLKFFYDKGGGSHTDNINDYQGGVPRTGIVQNELDDNGYPVLENGLKLYRGNNAGTSSGDESLAYLFNPDTTVEGKASYKDVQGLLKVDANGNYTFDSGANFAELRSDNTGNYFIVYNTGAVTGTNSRYPKDAQFFPFNKGEEVFTEGPDGTLTSSFDCDTDNVGVNHFFGMTLTAEFVQPTEGKVSNGADSRDMIFDFEGDDDVWIFVDGILVADLGGVHDAVTANINFASGAVITRNADRDTVSTTTLAKVLEDNDVSTTQLQGDTLRTGTSHTLKVFFLERGGGQSNLRLSFNVMETRDNKLTKVDQMGDPMEDVVFTLEAGNNSYTLEATDENGEAVFEDTQRNPIDLGSSDTWTLKENTVDGYRPITDVTLNYNEDSGTLIAQNSWETGVTSSFAATVTQTGSGLRYGIIDSGNTGSVTAGAFIDSQTAQNGLIVAVPMLQTDTKGSNFGTWAALYGSGLSGYHGVAIEDMANDASARKAIVEAALKQLSGELSGTYDTDWYLEYDEDRKLFEGQMRDLPGTADRYYFLNDDGDILMGYYFFDLDALQDKKIISSITSNTTREKAQALVSYYNGNETNAVSTLSGDQSYFGLLYLSSFNRQFYTRLTVPNIQNELWVEVLDANGNSMIDGKNGIEFGLYSTVDGTTPIKTGTLTPINENKSLIKFEGAEDILVSGETYYLKQISTVDGYEINETAVPIVVTAGGVFADAGTDNDGISVRKGLGKLVPNMRRYATDGFVNVTLRDITATMTTSDNFTDWDNSTDTIDFTYKYVKELETEDYAPVKDEDADPALEVLPYFETETGYVGLKVTQTPRVDGVDYGTGKWVELNDTDLTNLFSGSTTVVVTNQAKEPDPTKYEVTFKQGDHGTLKVEGENKDTVEVTVTENNTKDQTLGEKQIPDVEVTTDGYEFVGWKYDDDNDDTTPDVIVPNDDIDDITRIVINRDIIFTADYKLKTYEVTFINDTNGSFVNDGTPTVVTVEHGKNVTAVPTPDPNAGYHFKEWQYLDDDGVTIITISRDDSEKIKDIVIKRDITFTAIYETTSIPVTYYTVTFNSGSHGDFNDNTTSKVETVEKGQKLNQSQIPTLNVHSGYTFVGWRWNGTTYSADQVLAMTINQNMTFTAEYKEKSSGGSSHSSGGKKSSSIKREDGEKVLTDEHFAYIVGYEDGKVRPMAYIRRGEVAVIYFRLLDADYREKYLTSANTFPDVKDGDWYNTAVSTLANAGIISGRDDGKFHPNDPITRAELATIVSKFADLKEGENSFIDVSGHWAERFINSAATYGWISGYPDSTFRPDQYITRAEVMTLTNNVLERAVQKDGMHKDMRTWIDNVEGQWYYETVQEATNSHDYTRNGKKVSNLDFEYETWSDINRDPDWSSYSH